MADSKKNLRKSSDPWITLAESKLKHLRSIPSQYATGKTVAEYRRAVSLLSHVVGSPLWFEAQTGLGSHLLASPDGNHAANIESSQRVYNEILEHASPDNSPHSWKEAVWGLADSLWMNPLAKLPDFEKSSEIYEGLIKYLRNTGDAEGLAGVLGNCAQMHATWLEGDVDAHLEYAIQIQEEAIQVLAQTEGVANRTQIGQAQYILAALYLQRRTGIRSQNVDRAIRALRISLHNRPVEEDLWGRVRTLRALEIAYPEWSGADSLAHAYELADAAAAEADQIEQNYSQIAQGYQGWKKIQREQSALKLLPLDELLYEEHPPDERVAWLNAVIENHEVMLRDIPKETMPVQWAEWMGGLARLLGRYPSLGIWEHLEETYNCFNLALAAINSSEHPRLYRDLLQRFGEFCHEIGDFNVSLRTYGGAADISDRLFDAFADPEHQWIELEQTPGFALFAAYAAARVGQPEEAVRFAEQQRMRALKDMLDARRVLPMVSEECSSKIRDAVTHIQQIEDSLRHLNQRDTEAELLRIQGRIADFAGVDPRIIQMRRIDKKVDAANPVAAERNRLRSELAEARSALHALLKPEESGDNTYSPSLSAAEISSIAKMINRALVYLIATVHGGMAIIVLPDSTIDTLPLEDMTSDVTNKQLLRGNERVPGFLSGSMLEDSNDFHKSLNAIRSILGPAAMVPLTSWLKSRGVMRAVLIPLGSVGLLPIHIAGDDEVVFSYAPSARAFALSSAAQAREIIGGTLVVANPSWEDENPLPFAVAEARAISNLMNTETSLVNTEKFVRTCVAPDATFAQVGEGACDTSCIHFACHGIFRPSEPLASHLLLAGNDQLNLADVFSGRIDFSGTRLITLSACQSGNVEFRRAPDESLGFPSALMLAGVPSIVSTLWKVDDAAAMFFTVRFYELLVRKNLEPVNAVALARVWLQQANVDELKNFLQSIRNKLVDPTDEETDAALSTLWRSLMYDSLPNPPYASPEFWGAFILTGM